MKLAHTENNKARKQVFIQFISYSQFYLLLFEIKERRKVETRTSVSGYIEALHT